MNTELIKKLGGMNTPEQAQAVLDQMTTIEVIEAFEKTDGQRGVEVYEVRGWLIDELNRRAPKAFDQWMDLCNSEDSPRRIFTTPDSVPQWAMNAANELVEMHGVNKSQRDTVARLISHHEKNK